MTPTLLSLLAITFAFSTLILWVFWPSRREHLEALGQIPLETGQDANTSDSQTQKPEVTR